MDIDGKWLVFRADGDTRIGTGHAMRCLALAQAWQDCGGHTVFVMASCASSLEERLRREGVTVSPIAAPAGSTQDAALTIEAARRHSARWIVVDGYQFDADYQKAIKAADLHLVFVDDFGHSDHYAADYILNQGLDCAPELYASREPYTQILDGSSYILLRREFRLHGPANRVIADSGHRVLVTLGGSDPDGVTGTIMAGLARLGDSELEVQIVAGGANPRWEALREQCARARQSIRLHRSVDSMAQLMDWADIAVTAGGTTCWETAFMGLPSLIVVLADNQEQQAAALDRMGIAHNLGWRHTLTPAEIGDAVAALLRDRRRREAMATRGSRLVDGRGAERVLEHILKGAARP